MMTLDHLVYFTFFSPRLKELTIALSLMDLGKQLKSSMVECQTTRSAGTIPFPSLRWLTLLVHDLDPSNLRAWAHLLVALIPESAILNVYIRPSELSFVYKYNGRPSKEYLAKRGAMESQLPLIIKEIRKKIAAGRQKGRN
ncbi:hypothetical protein FRC03_005641 [Tulasnella sp. 419]|nr:hypothetical protein FRC03_005641 [Tulasnella sp. 419]